MLTLSKHLLFICPNPTPAPSHARPPPAAALHGRLQPPPPPGPTHLPSRLAIHGGRSPLHPVALPDPHAEERGMEELLPPSAAAVAAAIRRASPASPVEFMRRAEKQGKSGLVMPSADFQRLCVEQLELFRMVVSRDAVLSVYVRPAGSYIMDQLELRRVVIFPGADVLESAECVILVGNFSVAAGLRSTEAALLKQQVGFVPEHGAVVVPMVKHPFVVGFLVAELPNRQTGISMRSHSTGTQLPFQPPENEPYNLPSCSDDRMLEMRPSEEESTKTYSEFTIEQRSRAIVISRSLAMAYVMDQKALLLQQTSWQNNVRMSHLVEQIRGPLSSIRALAKMLSIHVKRSEIPYDIIEDILTQGDHMKDALQQIQDAVYLTKANIVRYNEEALKKMHGPMQSQSSSLTTLLSEYNSKDAEKDGAKTIDLFQLLGSERKDMELPMPPLWLIPLQQHGTRPCNICEVLRDLVGAALPLASKQQRSLELSIMSHPFDVAVEESALRQALSNLIEGALLRTQVGGEVHIYAGRAPAGGALVVIDDNGPDMQYMTQMHSLTPFGVDLFADGMLEDNMAWNFIAGLTVAREILESYGSVVRVVSPHKLDAAIGTGGTRIELWLPVLQPDLATEAQ